jgi:hypothetical protein
VGPLPIDHRRELLGEAQPIPTHVQVDGETKVEPGEVDGNGLRRRWPIVLA